MFAISYPYLEYWKNWNIGRFLSLGGLHVSIFSSHGVFFSWHFLYTLKSATIIQYTIKGRFMSR